MLRMKGIQTEMLVFEIVNEHELKLKEANFMYYQKAPRKKSFAHIVGKSDTSLLAIYGSAEFAGEQDWAFLKKETVHDDLLFVFLKPV